MRGHLLGLQCGVGEHSVLVLRVGAHVGTLCVALVEDHVCRKVSFRCRKASHSVSLQKCEVTRNLNRDDPKFEFWPPKRSSRPGEHVSG